MLKLLPAQAKTKGGAYGFQPNVTSWGAGPPVRMASGEYYLAVTEMVKGCGLQHWETNSQVGGAV